MNCTAIVAALGLSLAAAAAPLGEAGLGEVSSCRNYEKLDKTEEKYAGAATHHL